MKNILKKNDRQQLVNLEKKYPNLNAAEKKIIFDAMNKLNQSKTSQENETLNVIRLLRQLSLKNQLSSEGKVILTKLQRSQWIWGILYNIVFFSK